MTELKTIDIDTMPAGRKMDSLVAKRIFEVLKVIPYGTPEGDFFCHLGQTPDGGGISEPLAHYSTSIAAAWEVAEKLRADTEYDFRITAYSWGVTSQLMGGTWKVSFHEYEAIADTAPLAICRAAWKAKQ